MDAVIAITVDVDTGNVSAMNVDAANIGTVIVGNVGTVIVGNVETVIVEIATVVDVADLCNC